MIGRECNPPGFPMCYNAAMRHLLISLALIVCAFAAEPGNARAMGSLELVDWGGGGDGLVELKLKNSGTSSQRFDYHAIEAIDYQTGQVLSAGDIRFSVEELASYDVSEKGARWFNVVFYPRHEIAAIRWVGSNTWIGMKMKTFADVQQAIAGHRDLLAKARLEHRKKMLVPMKPGLMPVPTAGR